MSNPSQRKICSRCKRKKPALGFRKNRCRDCQREYHRGWRQRNEARHHKNQIEWRERNPEKVRAYSRDWWTRNAAEEAARRAKKKAEETSKERAVRLQRARDKRIAQGLAVRQPDRRTTEVSECENCHCQIMALKQNWHRRRFCSKRCANLYRSRASNSLQEFLDRENALTECKYCLTPMKAWRRSTWKTRTGRVRVKWHRKTFCSIMCSSLSYWDDPASRASALAALKDSMKAGGDRLREWTQSPEGRDFARTRPPRRPRIITPTESRDAAKLAALAVSAIRGLSGDERQLLVSPKFDGRCGAEHWRAHRVVRLEDAQIFDTARNAAHEIDGTDQGVSRAIQKGTAHRGYHFMLLDDWIAAAKPTGHPAAKSSKRSWRLRKTNATRRAS